MSNVQVSSASVAPPSPEVLRRSRIEAAGVSAVLAASLIAIAFPAPKRDDVSTLHAVTNSRIGGSHVG